MKTIQKVTHLSLSLPLHEFSTTKKKLLQIDTKECNYISSNFLENEQKIHIELKKTKFESQSSQFILSLS